MGKKRSNTYKFDPYTIITFNYSEKQYYFSFNIGKIRYMVTKTYNNSITKFEYEGVIDEDGKYIRIVTKYDKDGGVNEKSEDTIGIKIFPNGLISNSDSDLKLARTKTIIGSKYLENIDVKHIAEICDHKLQEIEQNKQVQKFNASIKN